MTTMTSAPTASAPRPSPPGPQRPSRSTRLLRGAPEDPSWARPALLGLLLATAVLYLWDLGASGDANTFYASAVQAGTQSWKAMFFGSLDAGNAITVDKPAFFLWPMEIAGRLFGFSSWSMLVPQALEGVAAVALLHAAVRRVSGPLAGLLAGTLLAVTPVAVLMFRFNNPDAMLVLLLTGATYCVVRGLETGRTRWVTLAGTLVGLGFITKMGQALLVVPALGLAYLVSAPVPLERRITDLLGAGVAMVAASGWYIAVVDLWPASSRPYIGGSTTNSLLELALGYNGIGRLLGGAGNGGGGGTGGGVGGGGANFGGATGLTRLLSGDFATEISWLLPTALLALAVGLWLTRRAPRTDLSRAALLLFGGSMVVTGVVFSYMQGTIHPYYSLALAPGIAGVLAVTARQLWLVRSSGAARATAATLVLVTALWDVHLLALTPSFVPWLSPLLVVAAALAAAALVAGPWLQLGWRRGGVVLVAVALLAGIGGSGAYALSTAAQPHTGSTPSAGPVSSGRDSGPGGFAGGTSSTSTALTALLASTTTRWAAATTGSMSAGPLQLASGKAVMAIGGFTGSDPAPTLAQFEAWVASGQIHYYVSGGGFGGGFGGPGGSTGSGSAITSWVTAHFTATTVGGTTVYDLTAPTS